MSNRYKNNILSCVLLCFVLVQFGVVNVLAAESKFELNSVQVDVDRLFTLSLEYTGEEICAFTAHIEYDSKALEYRSAKVLDENAEFCVNDSIAGEIKLVYLCEKETDCFQKIPLMELKFKSLKEGEHPVSLDVSQVVNSNLSDVCVESVKGAVVSVTDTHKADSNAQKDKFVNKEAQTSDQKEITEGETKVYTSPSFSLAKEGTADVLLIITSAATVLVLLCLVGFCAFKFGIKSADKKKEQKTSEDSDL